MHLYLWMQVRHGDFETLRALLGPSGFIFLSPNLGETRSYNTLAKVARGALLLFVQDDWELRGGCGWLPEAIGLFRSLRRAQGIGFLGLLGFDVAVTKLRCGQHDDEHATLSESGSASAARCTATTRLPSLSSSVGRGGSEPKVASAESKTTGRQQQQQQQQPPVPPPQLIGLEAAMCVSMGPLLMPRALFIHLGGFDERLSKRGTPSSLLDCELSARCAQRPCTNACRIPCLMSSYYR